MAQKTGRLTVKKLIEPKKNWQMSVYPIFTLSGAMLIMAVFIVGLFVLAPTATSYWAGSTKAIRDAAEVGSGLLAQLEVLNTIPRWLEPRAFLGVASFMFGIALEFSTIPSLLKNRGDVMGVCFPEIVKSTD
jgi:hypothetical protein